MQDLPGTVLSSCVAFLDFVLPRGVCKGDGFTYFDVMVVARERR